MDEQPQSTRCPRCNGGLIYEPCQQCSGLGYLKEDQPQAASVSLLAGDIRLMSKADLQQRVRELLEAEDRHVATMERQAKEIERLRALVTAPVTH